MVATKQMTIRSFAEQVGVAPDKLLGQLTAAGLLYDSVDDDLSAEAKRQLITHLRGGAVASGDGESVRARRKATSNIKQTSKTGGVRTVHVEVRKKRTVSRPPRPSMPPMQPPMPEPVPVPEVSAEPAPEAQSAPPPPPPGDTAEVEAKDKAEAKAETKAETGKSTETVAPDKDDSKKSEVAADKKSETTEAEAATATAAAATEVATDTPATTPSDTPGQRKGEGGDERKGARKAKDNRRSKLHVAADKKSWRRKPTRRPRKVQATIAALHGGFVEPTAPVVHKVQVPESITVGELAQAVSVKTAEVIRKLMDMGSMVTINQALDQDTAIIVVQEMGHEAVAATPKDIEAQLLSEDSDTAPDTFPRPPIVTVMGHVDHGKTSLLDYIRKTKVAAGEAGGITQHIGAYRVSTDKGEITFLDTPGHEAFSAMRARGARATDIVILVVAINDGIKPQTVEAIHHARNASVPVVVAINKIDLEEGNEEKIKQELASHNLAPENWGGDTLIVGVSAKTGAGVDELLEAVLLQAEILDLSAPHEGPVEGVVVEARIDKGRGAVATLLVQKGTLAVGDVILAGQESGKVRTMNNESGRPVQLAGPATPIEVQGLSGVPAAGDAVIRVADERKAREIASLRQGRTRSARQISNGPTATADNAFQGMGEVEIQDLNLVIKADVQGSVEALRESLEKLTNDEVRIRILHGMVGGINESDVHLAMASDAIILGFNVRADAVARGLIESDRVDVRYHSIIYHALDDLRKVVSGMLKPEIRENVFATIDVREIFKHSRAGSIAGCYVHEGTVRCDKKARVLRDNIVVFDGRVDSLRRFKEDVEEVRSGTECGIGIKNYNDIRVHDQIEIYETIEVPRSA